MRKMSAINGYIKKIPICNISEILKFKSEYIVNTHKPNMHNDMKKINLGLIESFTNI